MTIQKITPEVETFTFEASTKFEIKLTDLTDLLITAGQGCYFWGRVFVNIDPRKPFKKQDLKIEKEGGIIINTNNLNLDWFHELPEAGKLALVMRIKPFHYSAIFHEDLVEVYKNEIKHYLKN